MRKSYVWLEGELREKAGDNSVTIAGEKWYNFGGSWSPLGQVREGGPYIQPDIKPYQSMITGELITSRSHHREHLRSHGCVEVGNEKLPAPKKDFTATQGLRQELIARYDQERK
jgi:hypothetical protein